MKNRMLQSTEFFYQACSYAFRWLLVLYCGLLVAEKTTEGFITDFFPLSKLFLVVLGLGAASVISSLLPREAISVAKKIPLRWSRLRIAAFTAFLLLAVTLTLLHSGATLGTGVFAVTAFTALVSGVVFLILLSDRP